MTARVSNVCCTLAALGAMLLGTSSLAPLISGYRWWLVTALVLGMVALAGIACRGGRITVVVVPLAQAAVALMVLTAIFTPGDALAQFLPTPSSLETLVSLCARGQADAQQHPAPAGATDGLILLTAVSVGLLGIVVDFLAVTARAPALTVLPLGCLLVVPLAAHDKGVGWIGFALTATGFLALLAVDGWVRDAHAARKAGRSGAPVRSGLLQAASTTSVAAAATAVALLVPAAVPGLSSDSVRTLSQGISLGGRSVTATHPLVSLRRDLAANPDTRVLEYSTAEPSPDYLRTYVLDEFDGENWTMTPIRASTANRLDGGSLPPPPGGPDTAGGDGDTTTTDVTATRSAVARGFLPLPYPPRTTDVEGDWFADPESLMVFTPDPAPGGLSYQVTSRTPAPDPSALDTGGSGTAGRQVDGRSLEVPSGVDGRVADLTRSVTEGASTPHERAVALQRWFTGGDRFDYDLSPPRVPEGKDPLTHFLLEDRVGYCEQFAGAMALMARQAGIPARVAVGYTSGENVIASRWEVTAADAHAWPELYFPGQGWLRFEPTPSSSDGQGSASVPSYAESAPEGANDDDAGGASPSEPDPSAAPSDDPGHSARPEPSEQATEPSQDSGSGPDTAGRRPGGETLPGPVWGAVLVAGAALLLAVPMLPMLARGTIRRMRRRAVTPAARARAAWREMCDTAVDLGGPGPPGRWGQSPRTVARLLVAEYGLHGPERDALWRVALAEESARYAPAPDVPQTLASEVRTVRAALDARLGPVARLRANLLPRSLLRRHRG